MKIYFLILTLITMCFGLARSDNSKDREECADSLVGLATCLPYVEGNARVPTPDCCTGLKQVLRNKKKCLCVVIKDRNDPDLGLNINVTLALGLPQICNSPVNVSQCPALLNLPPNSPDAQIFYQYGQKSSNSSSIAPAVSPTAQGPSAYVIPRPLNGIGGFGSDSGRQTSGGSRNGMRWVVVVELLLSRQLFLLVLCLVLIV